MKKQSKKKLTALLAATSLLITSVISPFAYAASNELPDSSLLNAMGLTADEFANLPIETQAVYAGNKVHNITSVTKYFHVVSMDSTQDETCDTIDAINEIQHPENIFVEVSQAEYEAAEIAHLNQGMSTNGLSDSESISGTWYQITARLVEMEDGLGVTIGPYGQYVFSMTTTIIGDKLDPVGLHTDHVGYIAGSVNEDCSTIKNGEICTITLYSSAGGSQYETIGAAPYQGFGCGYNYSIGFMASKAEITMTFSFEPRQYITLVDAYSHLGYWDDNTSVADISLSIGPLSVSASPSKNLVRAPDLHLQLRV